MFERVAKYRSSMRQMDIAESKLLLWELVTHEPTVLQCFNVIEATCMAQGLFCRIDGEPCSDEFRKFLERHYVPFCKQALRAFFTYGFVPWVVRELDDGEEVPEVLPNGTFHWNTEIPSRSAQAVVQQENPGLVTYRVKVTAPLDVKDEDVNVFVFVPPALDVSVYSMLYATVPSPMSHVLIDYKNMRQAQIRRSHADAWNTTAKLICKFKPTVRVQEDPTSSLMDFADDSYLTSGMYGGMPLFAQLAATNLWTRDAQVGRPVFDFFDGYLRRRAGGARSCMRLSRGAESGFDESIRYQRSCMRLSRGAENGFDESIRHQRLSDQLHGMEEELRELMYDLKRFKRMDKGMDYFSETIDEITDAFIHGSKDYYVYVRRAFDREEYKELSEHYRRLKFEDFTENDWHKYAYYYELKLHRQFLKDYDEGNETACSDENCLRDALDKEYERLLELQTQTEDRVRQLQADIGDLRVELAMAR